LAVPLRGAAIEYRAREVVVATGGYDANLWFKGGDTPGVMTAEGALSFGGSDAAAPFRKGLIFGTGPQASRLLARYGAAFDALAAPGAIAPELVAQASALGVNLYPRSLLYECHGNPSVRTVRLAPRGGGPLLPLSVDAVVLAHRRLPNVQLLFQSGARMQFDRPSGAYYPAVDAVGQTSIRGLSAVGSCALPAHPEGTLPGGAPEDSPGPLEGYYRELFAKPRPKGKFVVCTCEDVLLTEVEDAHKRGYRGIEVIKRHTGLGTGLCQGRYCVPEALTFLSILERRTPAEVGYLTQRPPVVPVSLGALAALPAAMAEGEAT
jgi:hypothetical protein